MTYKEAFKKLIEELSVPSPEEENAYKWLTTGLSHSFLGVAAGSALSLLLPSLLAVLGVAVIYAVIKERRDVRNGGSLLDSLVDTVFTTAGAVVAAYGVTLSIPLLFIALAATVYRSVKITGVL